MKALNSMMISGKEILPLIEGGKGVSVTNGQSSGAWAAAGGAGTFSGVNADWIDDNGDIVPLIYNGKTRRERHDELMEYSVKGAISQARRAFDVAKGAGRIHMNVLWEMGGVERVLNGVLEGAKGLIHGVTCGAGMPYKLSEICAKFGVHYYPIVSSSRAFNALWKRAYHKFSEWLGGVVYEDPWRAGGHNGLSNSEDPTKPQSPLERLMELRKTMNEFGLEKTPIIIAGGVWQLSEWEEYIDHPQIAPVAFQFGTRPLLTQESPISDNWKKRLLTLDEGDVFLNKFSPTGFYSSAVNNPFIQELRGRSERQVSYTLEPIDAHQKQFPVGPRGRIVYLTNEGFESAHLWVAQGNVEALRTPDNSLIFVTPDVAAQIHQDQVDCMGCLSACMFSNWSQSEEGTTGKRADPRSFCIQKTLHTIAHSDLTEDQLMFAGHNAYRFASDPFYKNGFIPTVQQLVDRIMTGQ